MESERGQSTVEWVGLVLLVGLLLVGLLAAGVRVPGTALADSIAREDPLRGVDGRQLRRRAAPDRRLRHRGRQAGPRPHADHRLRAGLARRPGRLPPLPQHRVRRRPRPRPRSPHRKGLPVSAFVHVVDCRPGAAEESEAEGADCSGDRAGNLYIQYWTYYADSATLRGVPIVGDEGYHPDDWEGVQIRIGSDGKVDERASSHNGYNYAQGVANWGSDAGHRPAQGPRGGGRHPRRQRLGPGDPLALRLRRQPRRQRQRRSPALRAGSPRAARST